MKICPSCLRILIEKKDFYFYKDNTSYPICKECRLKNVDDYNIITILQLCKDFDIPFVEKEWQTMRYNFHKKKDFCSAFGAYLSKMKLCSWKGYTYQDSSMLNKMWEDYEHRFDDERTG